MAFNLDQFRSNFPGGGARTALFEMVIQWPTGIVPQASVGGATIAGGVQIGGLRLNAGATFGGQASDVSRFLVKVSEIPASTIGNISVPYLGRKLTYPGDRTFEPLTITIINDENFSVRNALERWMETMAYHSTAGSAVPGSLTTGLITTLYLTQYTRNGQPARQYKFVDAWPDALGAISVNWETADSIEEYTCKFQYQWWEAGSPTVASTSAASVG